MPPILDREFVRRQGSVLTCNGLLFRFAGNNLYFNQADIAYGRAAVVEECLDKMAALGLTVVRANAHNDHDPAADPAAIQTAPGQFVESSLVALDRSVALAKARNIRLILKFTNYWEAYGGIRRYVYWHLNRTPTANETGLFYTEPRIKGWYRDYVRAIIDRRNTVTGITYRDEPAILAWELANELRHPAAPNVLVAWCAEMAAYIRQLDANHLIADGGEGFDDTFPALAQIPELDMVSYHLYPANWGMNDGADAARYIRRREEIARQAGKAAYMGEFGKPAADAARARIFRPWLHTAVVEQASAGVMLWQLIDDARADSEGYGVYSPRDTETCAVLAEVAAHMAVTLAPGSLATIR